MQELYKQLHAVSLSLLAYTRAIYTGENTLDFLDRLDPRVGKIVDGYGIGGR